MARQQDFPCLRAAVLARADTMARLPDSLFPHAVDRVEWGTMVHRQDKPSRHALVRAYVGTMVLPQGFHCPRAAVLVKWVTMVLQQDSLYQHAAARAWKGITAPLQVLLWRLAAAGARQDTLGHSLGSLYPRVTVLAR